MDWRWLISGAIFMFIAWFIVGATLMAWRCRNEPRPPRMPRHWFRW